MLNREMGKFGDVKWNFEYLSLKFRIGLLLKEWHINSKAFVEIYKMYRTSARFQSKYILEMLHTMSYC